MARTGFVVDPSAILALLNEEAGADRVASCLRAAVVSTVSVVEVVTKLVDGRYPLDVAVKAVDALDMDEIAFDSPQARAAAQLATTAQGRALSPRDRACLALAHVTGRVAVTTGRAWARPETSARIELAR
ncbi:MAG TPA: PIN domain-containing protein [Microvirga sp.]|nr:PIN domain-containing protein [Microvirga sp.]